MAAAPVGTSASGGTLGLAFASVMVFSSCRPTDTPELPPIESIADSERGHNLIDVPLENFETPTKPKNLDPPSPPLRSVLVSVGEGGPAAAFAAAGVAEMLDVVDAVFLGRLDLYAHLVSGSSVTLWLDTRAKLAAVAIRLRSTQLVAARYEGELGPPGWYDEKGFNMRGPILGRPVSFSRITSRFGDRFDPLTGAHGKHRGTDYAVPIGTPVVAVADGIVEERAMSGDAGLFIRLMHSNAYESLYLHLSNAAGIERGTAVRQGQVIGLSGNSGRSTGPHVHYELRHSRLPLDPLLFLPLPTHALGPLAMKSHTALIASLFPRKSQ